MPGMAFALTSPIWVAIFGSVSQSNFASLSIIHVGGHSMHDTLPQPPLLVRQQPVTQTRLQTLDIQPFSNGYQLLPTFTPGAAFLDVESYQGVNLRRTGLVP